MRGAIRIWLVIAAALVVIALVLAATLYWVPRYDEPGVFGDMFGGANALFSGLAFVGVIVAILLQGDEIRLQRREIEQTREATETVAKLSALSQLAAYHKQQMERYGEQAFEEMLDPNTGESMDVEIITEILAVWKS